MTPIFSVSAGKAQKGDYIWFVKWDNDKPGGRFFECKIVRPNKMGGSVQVLTHDGDSGSYKETDVFKMTDCPAEKGDRVIAYWDNRAYAFSGK